MRAINSKLKSHNFNKIISIALPAALIILVLHVSCGRQTESSENPAVNDNLELDTKEIYEALEGGQTITINLPDLPENAKKLEMVLIKPGSFVMGSPKEERGRSKNDWPPHRVNITKPFYMGKFEVTQAQWETLMRKNPSRFRGKPNHPVEKVTWQACQKLIKRLNMLGQGIFRLPTEAEWEYCCRAGSDTRFSFGDSSFSFSVF